MRMESIEYYALVSMYTHGLLGQANELTCDQVDRLIQRRTNSGIMTGGRPLVPQLQRRRRARLRELRLSLRGRSDGSAERLFRAPPSRMRRSRSLRSFGRFWPTRTSIKR